MTESPAPAPVSDLLRLAEPMLAATEGVDLVATFQSEQAGGEIAAELARIAVPDIEVNLYGPDAGLQSSFRGVDGFIAAWRDWTAPFSEFSWRATDPPVRNGNRLVNFVEQRGTIAGTDTELTAQSAALWHFDANGRLERMDFHLNRDEALRALGDPD